MRGADAAARRRPSPPRIAQLAAEFLDRLNMDEVTLVGNDTGGALAPPLMAGDANVRRH